MAAPSLATESAALRQYKGGAVTKEKGEGRRNGSHTCRVSERVREGKEIKGEERKNEWDRDEKGEKKKNI